MKYWFIDEIIVEITEIRTITIVHKTMVEAASSEGLFLEKENLMGMIIQLVIKIGLGS